MRHPARDRASSPAEATIIALSPAFACRRPARIAPPPRPLSFLAALVAVLLLASLLVGCASAGTRVAPPVRQAAARPAAPPPRPAARPAVPQVPVTAERPTVAAEPDPTQVANAEPVVTAVRPDGANRPYRALGRDYLPLTADVPVIERGQASWYGHRFHGRLTASGETYDMHAMTAAHPTLPLPSYAVVRNPANGREVVVRVNDRGPFHSSRIIDLSHMAARKLGIGGVGTVEVRRLTNDEIRTGSWRRSPTDPVAGDDPRLALRRSDALMASAAAVDPPAVTEDAGSALASSTLPPATGASLADTTTLPAPASSTGIDKATTTATAATAATAATTTAMAMATEAATSAAATPLLAIALPPPAAGPSSAPAEGRRPPAAVVAAASPATAASGVPATSLASAAGPPAAHHAAGAGTALSASASVTPGTVSGVMPAHAAAAIAEALPPAGPVVTASASSTAPGTIPVALTAPTPGPGSANRPAYWVQLGAFRVREGADSFRHRLAQELQWLAPGLSVLSDTGLHRLLAGPYASRDQASGVAQRLRDALRLVPLVVERR